MASGNTDVSNVMNQIISIKNELNSFKQNSGGSSVAKSKHCLTASRKAISRQSLWVGLKI